MAADVTEIKRMADVMQASEHYAHDKVGVKIRKLESKYSKFKAVFEQRKKIVSSSVVMYKGISEVGDPVIYHNGNMLMCYSLD